MLFVTQLSPALLPNDDSETRWYWMFFTDVYKLRCLHMGSRPNGGFLRVMDESSVPSDEVK